MGFAISLTLLVLFLIAGAIPVQDRVHTDLFQTLTFIGLMGVLCLTLMVISLRRRWAPKTVGFLLTHLGAAAILVGGLIGYLTEQKGSIRLPVSGGQTVRYLELSSKAGGVADLGFSFSVKSFEVDHYEPDYDLYQIKSSRDIGRQEKEQEYVRLKTIRNMGEGPLDLGPAGQLDRQRLQDESGAWLEQYILDNGWLLRRQPAADKRYDVRLLIQDDGMRPVEARVEMNRPFEHRGWRLYLWDYDRESEQDVELIVRRDPGRPVVIGGMWVLIVGTVVMCWVQPEKET